ncbi:MAG: DUF6838 family protein [Desulfitobacterium sp.]
MPTLLDINKAINDKIETTLVGTAFSMVPLVAEDVSEPITRPSIKVEIDSVTSSNLNPSSKEKTLTCRVYFFASDRYKYKIENAKIQDLLENAVLGGVSVGDGFYPIDEVSSETTDTVLICSFDLYAVELLPEPTVNGIGEPLEPMETLTLNLVKE